MLNSIKSLFIRSSRILGGLMIISLLIYVTGCSNNMSHSPKAPETTYYEGPFSSIPVTQDWQYSGKQGTYTVTLKLSKYRMLDEVKTENHPAKNGFLAANVCPNIENSGVLAGVITIKMGENKIPFAPSVELGVLAKNQHRSKIIPKVALDTGTEKICRAFERFSIESLKVDSVKSLAPGETVTYPVYLIFTPYKGTNVEKATPDTPELDNFSISFLPVNTDSGKYNSSGASLALRHIIDLGK